MSYQRIKIIKFCMKPNILKYLNKKVNTLTNKITKKYS